MAVQLVRWEGREVSVSGSNGMFWGCPYSESRFWACGVAAGLVFDLCLFLVLQQLGLWLLFAVYLEKLLGVRKELISLGI